MWGDVGRYGEMWKSCSGSPGGRYGEMRGDVGRCGEVWGGVGRCGEMRGDVGRCAEIWGGVRRSGEIRRALVRDCLTSGERRGELRH